jgi:hypothetical protein
VRVNSSEELTAFVRRCLSETGYATELGRRAIALVKEQQGATARTWDLLEPLLPRAVDQADASRTAA